MQLKRVLSTLTKNGVDVKPHEGHNTRYIATKGQVVLEFYENGKDSNYVGYFVERSPQTDASTDCFCDSFYNTIKAALARLNAGR